MTSMPRAVDSEDLVAELRSKAAATGANGDLWPGLTICRFDHPEAPEWEEVREMCLCVIAQGQKRVIHDGSIHYYGALTYVAIRNSSPFLTEIVEATPDKPFLSFGLSVDPTLIRTIAADIIAERDSAALTKQPRPSESDWFVSPVSTGMLDAILRFLRALDNGADRRVLAPTYLMEIVYRALQTEQYSRLVERASAESASNPINTTIAYIREHLCEPMSVSDLAERAHMSPSGFAHVFKDSTGTSPYQFIKEMRLNRARELLVEDHQTITQICTAVGYRSTSHFTNEFRDRFSVTPRAFRDALADGQGPTTDRLSKPA